LAEKDNFIMAPPASSEPDEHSVPDCSKTTQNDASCSPWKSIKGEDGRNYSYTDTASLTCSDSLNSSLTDTDEETCSLSPDNSLKTRHSRLSPIVRSAELPRSLHVIEDLSFDSEYSLAEEKVHAPSKKQKFQTLRRRLFWILSLAIAGLVCYHFFPLTRRGRVDPQDWKRFLQHEAPRVRRLIEQSTIPSSFTIRLSGSRSDLLERSVDVLTRCASVEEVQVEWKSSMRPPRKLFRHESGKVTYVERLVTSSVLLLDEDVIFTCDELERGMSLVALDVPMIVTLYYSVANATQSPFLFQVSVCGDSTWTAWLDSSRTIMRYRIPSPCWITPLPLPLPQSHPGVDGTKLYLAVGLLFIKNTWNPLILPRTVRANRLLCPCIVLPSQPRHHLPWLQIRKSNALPTSFHCWVTNSGQMMRSHLASQNGLKDTI